MSVLTKLVPLTGGDQLRVTLEATPSGYPVVRVAMVVGPAGRLTPSFTLEVGDLRTVATALGAFADSLEREAAAHTHGRDPVIRGYAP
jgi:hypothetical protein